MKSKIHILGMFATLSLQDERSKVPKVIVVLRLDRQKANIRHMGDGFPAVTDGLILTNATLLEIHCFVCFFILAPLLMEIEGCV